MKKTFYFGLLVLLCINLSCETDEIFVNEQNETYKNAELNEDDQLRNSIDLDTDTSKSIITQPANIDIPITSNITGFGDDGAGGTGLGGTGIGGDDGTLYDGTNTLNNPPDVYGNTAVVTFASGTNENQKRELRVTYQITGELLYFEQCPSDPQKELWYLANTNVVVNDCSNSTIPCSSTRDKNPPIGHTPLSTVIATGITTVTGGGEPNTQITINNVIINVNANTFCPN